MSTRTETPSLTSSLRRVAFIMFCTKRRTMGLDAKSALVKTYEPATYSQQQRKKMRRGTKKYVTGVQVGERSIPLGAYSK